MRELNGVRRRDALIGAFPGVCWRIDAHVGNRYKELW